MQFFKILVLEFCRLAAEMFQQLAVKCACTSGRVEDLYVFVDEISPEMFFAEVVGALDHEAHDLIRCVDHTEPVGGFRIVDFVKVLVDDFQECLLLVMRTDLRGGGTDGSVVWFHALQRLVFGVALEKSRLQLVKLLCDVVVPVKRRTRKHGGKNIFGKDVLDQHLAHIRFGQARVDRFLGML